MESFEKLLQSCRKGDRSAQRKLYDVLASKMFAVCLRYMGRRDYAEDVMQDGFVTLFSHLESYSGTGSFEGWARKIFVNTALMELRKNDALKMSEDIDVASGLPSGKADSQVSQLGYKDLMTLVTALPDGYRTVFNMYAIEGYSHKEIAEALGISEVTSRSQLNRARAILKEKIKGL